MMARAKGRLERARIALVRVIAMALFTAPASAEERSECISLAEHGQIERQAGRLESSRRDFLRCSSETCPRVVRDDCIRWLAEVEPSMPSVVFFATDDAGHDLTDVRVDLDGVRLVERLDGRSIRVDPGQHTLVFARAAGGPPLRQTYLFVQGERDRKIAVRFPPSNATEASRVLAEPPRKASPLPLVVSGSVAFLGLAGFTAFGLSGKSDLSALDDSRCAPACDPADLDRVRTKLIVADVSLAVGVVSLGFFTYFLVRGAGSSSGARASLPMLRF